MWQYQDRGEEDLDCKIAKVQYSTIQGMDQELGNFSIITWELK
jgi:hypothetical protein